MKNIGFSQVNIRDGLMAQRMEINRDITVYAVYDRFCESGRFDTYFTDPARRAPNFPKNLHVFYDSDVVKLIEGAAYMLRDGDSPRLEEMIKLVEDGVSRNQDADGYFNSYFQNNEPENRFTDRNAHELYTAGHLFEAAVAVYEATGRRTLLDCAVRFAELIEKVFKKERSAKFLTPGHEEIELALVRLYHATGERRWLELAKHFVDTRGNRQELEQGCKPVGEYSQSHLPAREQRTAEGHSVRACYFYSGMADIAREYGDEGLLDACKAIFDNIVRSKMFITGGIGQDRRTEGFDSPFKLSNDSAYSETCAGIALAMFARRMMELDTDSKYADVVETLIYNGILSGVSLDGASFFYENPLELKPSEHRFEPWYTNAAEKLRGMPIMERVRVFGCSCCPPNICRFLASVGDYAYGRDGGTYYIHQYFSGDMTDGGAKISVETDYPHYGVIRVSAEGVERLALRIPGWCAKFSLDREYTLENGYAFVEGGGDVTLTLEMPVELIRADPRVSADTGRAALRRGPIVYCIESVDNGEDLNSLSVDRLPEPVITFDGGFGANVIEVNGHRELQPDSLYYRLGEEPVSQPVRLKYIPYFAFANRGESGMQVWVRLGE